MQWRNEEEWTMNIDTPMIHIGIIVSRLLFYPMVIIEKSRLDTQQNGRCPIARRIDETSANVRLPTTIINTVSAIADSSA